jgi:hypothetical protein
MTVLLPVGLPVHGSRGSNVAPPVSHKKVGRPKTDVPRVVTDTKPLRSSRPSDEAIRRPSNIATDVEVTDLKEPNLQRGEPKALNEARELVTDQPNFQKGELKVLNNPCELNQQASRRDKVIPTPAPTALIDRSPLTQSPDAFATLPNYNVPRLKQQLQQMLDEIVDTNPRAKAYLNTSRDVEHSPPAVTVPARGGGSTTVSADIHEDHIVEGPRVRKPSARRAAYLARLDGGLHEIENAFSNMNSAFSTATRPYKQHQNELPPPPDSFKMFNHPLSAEFKATAKAEWAEVEKKDTYEKISRPKGVKILPLQWVFGCYGFLRTLMVLVAACATRKNRLKWKRNCAGGTPSLKDITP